MLLSNAENWDAFCLDTGIFTIVFILWLLTYEITFKLRICVCSREFCSRPVDLGEQLAGVNSHFSFLGGQWGEERLYFILHFTGHQGKPEQELKTEICKREVNP